MTTDTETPTKKPVVRAVEVPDIRLHFIDQWQLRGDFYRSTVKRIMGMGYSEGTGHANAIMMHDSIKKAEMFWVSPAFMPLLLNAADSMPLDAKFSELPSLPPEGLLVFDAPDGWSMEEEGLPRAEVGAMSWHVGGMQNHDGSHSEDAVFVDSYARYGNLWIDLRSSSWGGDDLIAVVNDNGTIEDETSIERIQRDRKILGAFAHLIKETKITDSSNEIMPRAVARRSHNKSIMSTVRVVRLRHLVEAEKNGTSLTGSGIEYSHQWLVSGHWRNQPCGTGRSERKLIWISPHVKGPADKPLVLKDTVKALVR